MTRINSFDEMEFEDDEPVQLDCGCTAYPGDGYERHLFKVGNDSVYQTCCCEHELCEYNIFYEVLHKYKTVTYKGYTDMYCRTAQQEECAYDDDRFDSDVY